MLTGCRLGEIASLEWGWIRGKRIHLPGVQDRSPHRVVRSRGREAGRFALPMREGKDRVFPGDLNSHRLYMFWVEVRAEANLQGVRIHDLRHSWASQGVMNGVGLPTVGRLLGHRRRANTAIYTHLDDAPGCRSPGRRHNRPRHGLQGRSAAAADGNESGS